jgi:hypothetical protein
MGMGNVCGGYRQIEPLSDSSEKYFERAERAESPVLQAKFRELAREYRDQVVRLLGEAA